MRIVNIVTQMEAAGAQGAAIRMSEELRKRGHETEPWFLYLKRPVYEEEVGVRVMLRHAPRGPMDYVRLVRGLVAAIRAYRPEGIVTYTHYANIIGQAAALVTGIKRRVATNRNPVWSYPRLARILDRAMGTIGVYSQIICVSRAVLESTKTYPTSYRRRCEVIYNGVTSDQSVLDKTRARLQFGLPNGVPLIVTTGRLHVQKNHRFLLDVLQLVADVHLAIAGDGELLNSLQDEARRLGIEDRVHFLGEIPPVEVPSFLRSGDIFVFPSIYEAFGFSVVEAMSAGLLVITSPIPAMVEILGVDDQAVGLIVELAPQLWADVIQRTLYDDERRTKFGQKAMVRAKKFSLAAMVDGYERVLVS